jgi:hypothetical protein
VQSACKGAVRGDEGNAAVIKILREGDDRAVIFHRRQSRVQTIFAGLGNSGAAGTAQRSFYVAGPAASG